MIITLAFVYAFGNARVALGVAYGYLVSLINMLFAFFSMKWAFNKSNKIFFTVILGGMGVRFVVLIGALFFVWKFAQIPIIAFIISLIGFYLLLQFFEIKFIQKQLLNRKATS